jgi:uncharacterized GH25 family protein
MLITSFTCAAPALAHDFWLEPSGYRVAVGDLVRVAWYVGEHFDGDVVPRYDPLIKRFVLVGPEGERPIVGQEGSDTAGLLRLAGPGVGILALHSRHSTLEQTGAAFERYLREEGLEHVSRARAARGETGAGVTEIFSRSAKTLVVAGDVHPAGFDRVVGLPLELVAEALPQADNAATAVPIRLLYQGAPLEGTLVVAVDKGEPERAAQGRTDAEGRVRLRLPGDGPWLVKAVHMVPAPAGSGAQWESFWASLTFGR